MEESGPASTQLVQNALTGGTTLFVQSVAGFTAQKVYVYLDNGGFALTEIQSIDTGANSFVVLPELPSAASINQIVIAAAASDVND